MHNSMFARLLTVFLAVVLIVVAGLFALSYANLRSERINARLEALKTQAREMAYLASRLQTDSVERSLGMVSQTEKYMYWKAQSVYEEFGAYILVVDRSGSIRTFLTENIMRDEDINSILSAELIADCLRRVSGGEDVVNQTTGRTGPLFTVAVPWMQEGYMLGAVFIQTGAQTISSVYQDLGAQVALSSLAAFLLAAVCVFFFTRQITRPLTAIAGVAGEMSLGRFTTRAPEKGTREVRELAATINVMAAQLGALEQSRRDFVANVSHELRSPVTSIQGFAQGLLDGTVPQGERDKYLRVVVSETQRLSKLIASLLALSRAENDDAPIAYADFDICEMARRVLIQKMPQLESKALDVDTRFTPESIYARADADQIEQVLINLVDNAVKFTPEHGTITLLARREGDTVTVTVADDGPQIPKEDREFIFDRFYTADKAHSPNHGTGLGLSICKKILEKHGQRIRLADAPVGAAFEFTLAAGEAPQGGGAHDAHA